ncbi:MAG: CAP domain-containing protein [Gammaproteobacteria bacterium]
MEQLIHRQINRERQNHGLAALAWDKRLADIARGHSRDMAQRNFFSHFNLQGEGPTERAKHYGWEGKKLIGADTWAIGPAENIFLNHLYDKVITITENGIPVRKDYDWKTQQQIAESTVQGWMNSPGHRKNILSPPHERQGIGVAISGNAVYITENIF